MLPTLGLFCECCAASACRQCHWVLDKKTTCKPTWWPHHKTFQHHWTKSKVLSLFLHPVCQAGYQIINNQITYPDKCLLSLLSSLHLTRAFAHN